jgi:hypothetical protein
VIYTLQDILQKLGAPEVEEKCRVEWHFFSKDKRDLAGAASVRLEHGGDRLIAELKRTHDTFEDDNGQVHANYTDSFYLAAERTARPGHYRITTLSFDGTVYDRPRKAVVELALSMFHAKALDISIAMINQAFNKQDILERQIAAEMDQAQAVKKYFAQRREKEKETEKKKTHGVVIPFPVRHGGRISA